MNIQNLKSPPIIVFPEFQCSVEGLLLLEKSQDVNLMQDGQIKKHIKHSMCCITLFFYLSAKKYDLHQDSGEKVVFPLAREEGDKLLLWM